MNGSGTKVELTCENPRVFFPGNGILTRFNGIEIEFIGFHVIYMRFNIGFHGGFISDLMGFTGDFRSDFMGLNGVQSYLV